MRGLKTNTITLGLSLKTKTKHIVVFTAILPSTGGTLDAALSSSYLLNKLARYFVNYPADLSSSACGEIVSTSKSS